MFAETLAYKLSACICKAEINQSPVCICKADSIHTYLVGRAALLWVELDVHLHADPINRDFSIHH